jgi:hypothetical protein
MYSHHGQQRSARTATPGTSPYSGSWYPAQTHPAIPLASSATSPVIGIPVLCRCITTRLHLFSAEPFRPSYAKKYEQTYSCFLRYHPAVRHLHRPASSSAAQTVHTRSMPPTSLSLLRLVAAQFVIHPRRLFHAHESRRQLRRLQLGLHTVLRVQLRLTPGSRFLRT